MLPRVKICCISTPGEAALAVQYGASALGLVGKMPSGPGLISDDLIAAIIRSIPPGVSSFLLTSETLADSVIAHHQRTHSSTIQLVDSLKDDGYQQIRESLPAIKLVQVIHVLDDESVREAKRVAAHVDAILLDSGNPHLQVKELGGTGRVHNWVLSRKIVEQSPVPVWLAGGLNAGNVRRAMEEVQPFGLDLCSGVRTENLLDERKLEAFMRAVGH